MLVHWLHSLGRHSNEFNFGKDNLPVSKLYTSGVRPSSRLSPGRTIVPASPSCRWMDAPTPFEAWLKETGLVRPIDFKFAFCSAQEAAEACPNAAEAAAEAWLSVIDTEARLPSTWALWGQCRPGGKDRPVTKAAAVQAAPSWTGLRSRNPRKDEGPLNDIARRQAAAKDALHEALSWKGRGRLGIEWNASNKGKRCLGKSADYQDR